MSQGFLIEQLEPRQFLSASEPLAAPTLAGSVLTIDATATADRIRIDTRHERLRVTVNGTTTLHDRDDVSRIVVQGGGQDDRLLLYLGDTTDGATLRTRGTSVIRAGEQTITFAGVHRATIAGQASDSAVLQGSGGADTFYANPDVATLQSPGVRFAVHGFGAVSALGRGGADGARVVGSDGRDTFLSDGQRVTMRTDRSRHVLRQFETVTAEGGDGVDRASVLGTRGDDHAFLASDLSARFGGEGYSRRFTGFEHTFFTGWKSGRDSATIEDTAGDDVLAHFGPHLLVLRQGHETFLGGFSHVTATSSHGGSDGIRGVADDAVELDLVGQWRV